MNSQRLLKQVCVWQTSMCGDKKEEIQGWGPSFEERLPLYLATVDGGGVPEESLAGCD